jgi:hypothetical protein
MVDFVPGADVQGRANICGFSSGDWVVTTVPGFTDGPYLDAHFDRGFNLLPGAVDPDSNLLDLSLGQISIRIKGSGETDVQVFWRSEIGGYSTGGIPAELDGDPFSGNPFTIKVRAQGVPLTKAKPPDKGSPAVDGGIDIGAVVYTP